MLSCHFGVEMEVSPYKRDSDYNNKEISFDVAKMMKFILYLLSLLLFHF